MKWLRKKEALFISNKSAEVDLLVMAMLIMKEVDVIEHHIVSMLPNTQSPMSVHKEPGVGICVAVFIPKFAILIAIINDISIVA